jgi:hypothetical protein
VINMYSQATNSSILKNMCQAKQKKHMNKKKLNKDSSISMTHYETRVLEFGFLECF